MILWKLNLTGSAFYNPSYAQTPGINAGCLRSRRLTHIWRSEGDKAGYNFHNVSVANEGSGMDRNTPAPARDGRGDFK